MQISFLKVSDDRHVVSVVRDDGSSDRVELETRSFLRHDLAHYAVEVELGLEHGVWGSVAAGGSLSGEGLDGADMGLAESLAGPMQTMMRIAANVEEIRAVLTTVAPTLDTTSGDLAKRIHERLRRLAGHWNATGYGKTMQLDFPPPDAPRPQRNESGRGRC